jgi:hypothetical protein
MGVRVGVRVNVGGIGVTVAVAEGVGVSVGSTDGTGRRQPASNSTRDVHAAIRVGRERVGMG